MSFSLYSYVSLIIKLTVYFIIWIHDRKNRNMYAQLMLHMLKRGSIQGPFDKKPEEGPLPTLPSYMVSFQTQFVFVVCVCVCVHNFLSYSLWHYLHLQSSIVCTITMAVHKYRYSPKCLCTLCHHIYYWNLNFFICTYTVVWLECR